MTVEFTCRECQTTLRVSDEHIGKKARCPSCGSIQDVVSSSQQDSSESQSESSSYQGERWLMRTPDGNEYGPVEKSELDSWVREGRISAHCSLRQENQSQWNPASLVFPNLASASSAPSPQVSSSGNPFASPMQVERVKYPHSRGFSRDHNGVTIMVLGIVGFFCFGIVLGPVAWAMGASELKAIKRGEVNPEGQGMVTAGYVMGIIVTCMHLLAILFYCCVFLTAMA